MVVESIDPSTFQENTSLNSTYRNMRDALSLNNDFMDSISSAYTEGESPEEPDFFDLELTPGGFSDAALEGTLTNETSDRRDVDVTGGTVTFSSATGSEEFVAAPYHDVALRRNEEDTLVVMNRTTDRAVRLGEGESLTVAGDGLAEVAAADERTLRLEDGESVTLRGEDDSLELERSTFRDTIDLSDGSRKVSAQGEAGSGITLYTGPGESLQFDAEEGGTIEKTGDGSVRITNEETAESLTLAPTDSLKAGGDAEFAIGEDSAFEVEAGDTVRLFGGEDGLEVRNQSVAGSVSLGESVESPDSGSFPNEFPVGQQGRVYRQILNDPGSTMNLSENVGSLHERVVGTFDQVIEPFGERDVGELINGGLTLDGEEESDGFPFTAERQVRESFGELPSIFGMDEETDDGIWFDGGDDEAYFFEDEN